MQTYVYSLRGGAKVTHVGNLHGTACGFVFFSSFRVTENAPPNRPICTRCVGKAHTAAIRTARREGRIVDSPERIAERRARIAATRAARDAARQAQLDALIVAALKEGLTNTAIARRARMSMRTTVRRIATAQRRAGARSRFEWGHTVGLAEGRAGA
ncbi:MAG: hypothetical protein QOE45_1404 [Frankiaceae bacterium]|jgi:hypothetical protein|nr:hypothetical protein [Frankiaceae bacterium]